MHTRPHGAGLVLTVERAVNSIPSGISSVEFMNPLFRRQSVMLHTGRAPKWRESCVTVLLNGGFPAQKSATCAVAESSADYDCHNDCRQRARSPGFFFRDCQ
jgi:hypothetical protein